jgi:hypothetical protein
LPGIYRGQSFSSTDKAKYLDGEEDVWWAAQTAAGTGVTVHPVRKFISQDIARYIYRIVLSSSDKAKY